MNLAKKAAAASLSALILLSTAGCTIGADTNWSAKWEDVTVPAGVYLNLMMNAYYEVTDELRGDDGQAPKEPLKQQLNGVSVPDAITANAKDALTRYVAIERKFDEMELSIPPEQLSMQQSILESYWPYMESMYTQNGIAKDSYNLVSANSSKSQLVFEAVYGEGGEREVPDSELKARFEQDYAKILIIPLDFGTNTDEQQKAEADQKTRDFINRYFERAKAGENMEDLLFEAEQEAKPGEELTKPEPGTSFTFVDKENSSYEQSVTDAIFAAKIGEPTVAETESKIYLFVRYDVNENEDDFTSRKSSVLNALKNDEFEDLQLEWGKAYTDVTYNDAAFKRYTADKLKLS